MEKKPLRVAALILAAGRGTRAGSGLPKQWRALGTDTVAAQTVSVFQAHDQITEIAMVIHSEDHNFAEQISGVYLTHGGATRAASVLAGLERLVAMKPDLVLIHDVARPLVSAQVIDDVIFALATSPGAAPAIAVTDALWRGENGQVTGMQNREGLYRAQTPQGFHFDKIHAAHLAHPSGAADDVEVARHAGLDVAIVPGEERNMKITTPEDFARAETYLKG